MISELNTKAEILFIVPPFSQVGVQSLGLHSLQACARREGFSVKIFYANMHLASFLKSKTSMLCDMNYFLLGERMFARAAWGDKVPEQEFENVYNYKTIYNRNKNPIRFYPEMEEPSASVLISIEKKIYQWVTSLEKQFERLPYSYIGLTSSFEQNNASVALLKRIKKLNPQIKTLIGGYNCENNNALGIRSLDPHSVFLDYIFSGESEITFVDFLKNGRNGIFPSNSIIQGKPIQNMDNLPDLDYTDFFDQLYKYCPSETENKNDLNLIMETSRGCWWGEKSQCRFCGTSDRIQYREKSSDRILKELKKAEKWGIDFIQTTDLIMPYNHFSTLLPRLAENERKWKFYYEQKVSLNHRQMELLKNGGITEIQPGLESLSTKILKLMRKGTTLKQNLQFLRHSAVSGMNLYWNIVWGIPGESIKDYEEINALIPFINHLCPPVGVFYMTLFKFSPYFNEPEKYGINNIRPIPSYREVYPNGTEIDKISIMFTGQYELETLEDQSEIDKLIILVDEWIQKWNDILKRPRLQISLQGDGKAVLIDTRGIRGNEVKTELAEDQINVLLDSEKYIGSPKQNWALKIKAAILEENELISLVTIDPEIRKEYAD